MNYRIVVVCLGLSLALGAGFAGTSDAWLIDTTANVNTNSHNDSSTNVGDRSNYTRNTYDYNQRYDNRQDKSEHISDSLNTDNRNYSDNRQDRSVTDSNNVFDSRDMSDRSVDNSSTISAAGGVRNSVLGDFNQLYSGTDFRSGVAGSGNTIDTSSVNITTFGDATK